MKNYRNKIYRYYSSQRNNKLAPDTVDGLEIREPFFNDIIKKHFPDDKDINILDIGCGHGAFGYFIKNNYNNYIGIDGSIEQVEEAKRLGVENVIFGDIVEYLKNVNNDSLDLLIAIDIIEHFTKEELSDLIDEFYRVLKKGGKIITLQPNSAGPFGNHMRDFDYTHEQGFTSQSIEQIFLSSGFNNVESFEDAPIIHGMKSAMRFFLWKYIIKMVYRSLIVIERGGIYENLILSHNFLSVITK